MPEIARVLTADQIASLEVPEAYLGSAEAFRARLRRRGPAHAAVVDHPMPLIHINGGSCYYRLDGPDAAPVVVFSHSLGQDHGQWDAQALDLLPHVRVLRYDTRGHGASAAPAGDYTLDDLGGDVLALADALGIDRFAFCGLSLGGMVGQWLALHAADRLTHLVLANTTARVADPAMMEARRADVLAGGMAAVADVVMGRFFSPSMLAAGSPAVAVARRTLLATNPVGYAGCCAAIRDMDFRAALARITTPTLVIGGDLDVSMPWADHGGELASSIAGADAVRLPAAHLSNLERPRSFSAALFAFLLATPENRLQAGELVRRSVLGDAHVDQAINATTTVNRDFQALLTRVRVGQHLDAPRPRPAHASPAGADHHRRAGPLGGVPPPPAHGPGARAGMVRRHRGADAGRRLRRRAGGQHGVPDCGRRDAARWSARRSGHE